ncbi:DUF4124 domain-containing protein [Vogesella facilis]|uniref:DUF4124 domain-containing protein n=1 Tax=Vogesella facilis TaxID=1655232 RepID=A0ABV7RHE8_9NEIS
MLLAGLLAAGVAEAADVYRWVDANGRTVFSDTPPPGRRSSKLTLQPGGIVPAPEASAPDGKAPLDAKALAAKAQEQNRRMMAANCKTAKENLALMSKPPVPGRAPDAGKAEAIRRAQDDVKTWCQQ